MGTLSLGLQSTTILSHNNYFHGQKEKEINAGGRVITENIHKKVANMVETFLIQDSNGFQITFNKVESEKVTNTVGTFLTDQSDGFQISAIKMEPEKVTNMAGTFLTDEAMVSKYQPQKWNQKKVASTVATFFDQRYQFP